MLKTKIFFIYINNLILISLKIILNLYTTINNIKKIIKIYIIFEIKNKFHKAKEFIQN